MACNDILDAGSLKTKGATPGTNRILGCVVKALEGRTSANYKGGNIGGEAIVFVRPAVIF
jgi:hypothetical protein